MHLYSIETRGKWEPHIHQEWLLTNGLGSFASGTVLACNTRRYHSLLCAALKPPADRYCLLSRIGEVVTLDGQADQPFELSVNQFAGGGQVHPKGYEHLRRFDLGETAKWTYQIDDQVEIEKELLLCWRRNLIGVRYRIRPGGRHVRLELLPFVAMRDYHALRHGTDAQFQVGSWNRHVTITHDKLHLQMTCDRATWEDKPYWWYGHLYPIEASRGLDSQEDLWNPGRFVCEIDQESALTFWAASEPFDTPDFDQQLAARTSARQAILKPMPTTTSPAIARLWSSADAYIVDKTLPPSGGHRTGKTVIAGYPWFLDWGRDTMISLPGLLLSTGRHTDARDVLVSFAQHVSEGMIPNRFDDYTGEPSYNTVDASLWFIHTVYAYLQATNDRQTFSDTLLPACNAIADGYAKGTRYGIRMDSADGLITQGDPSTQLTWMDAKCEGIAFTPRDGKPVEINALWYHALMLLRRKDLAARVKESFRKAFWISPFRGLADVLNSNGRDTAIRPNQIFAVSLPHSPLDLDEQQAVVAVVQRELLTPYGLRTLARGNPHYRPRMEGGPYQRDEAYHNGTVWPWLIGPFLEAYLKVNRNSEAARAQCRQWLAPLIEHMNHNCLGHIAEVFDADEPQRPAGCCAQAWSDSEVLRLALILEI